MIGVVGTSHKNANLATREVITKALSSCEEKIKGKGILLVTCNRAEWYFCSNTPATIHQEMVSHLRKVAGDDVVSHLYTFFGLECFHHLGKVVSGLDSIFVGETEIQGQVKATYDMARKAGFLPQELHFLFQRALHTGKIVRGRMETPQYQGLCDQVSHLVSSHMKAVSHPSVLLIGTSMINTTIAHFLKATPTTITISNRTNERAKVLASDIGGQTLSWDDLPRLWCHFPCVIAATRSQDYLLRSSNTSTTLPFQLLIDLGVPRNIDPALASPERTIVNIEAFKPTQAIENELSERSWKDYMCLAQRTYAYSTSASIV
jgi:glutamyl-tRNA reductase